MREELLRVDKLTKSFKVQRGIFREKSRYIEAVKEISLSVDKGETLGLVGESGCGKSTTGKIIIGLIPPSCGNVYFRGEHIVPVTGSAAKARHHGIQMIFQNPYASLDPKMTLQRILEEPLRISRYSREQRNRRIAELLDYIGFSSSLLQRYPREFSGGQRQRIAIARALACNPEFIVLDEPVSALDVSIQAQILNLLVDLQREMGLTYLFISHDLGVVQYVSDRVCVMYLGKIVEMADFQSLYELQLHPYTKLLIQSVPVPDPGYKQELSLTEPAILQAAERIPGCQFQNRCPTVKDVCREKEPELVEYRKGHLVACHLYTPPEPTGT